MRHWKTMVALAGLACAALPAMGADYPNSAGPANPPEPGAVNYIEGSAFLDGSAINNQNVGAASLGPGEVLTTGAGKAEILLTPGIFLRLGSNSAVKMITPDLAQTQVALERGRAAVEVDQIFKQNMVQVIDGGVTVQLMKDGYYEFDANQPEVMVFKGQAEVEVRPDDWQKVKGDREVALAEDARAKEFKFDDHPTNDALYNWSSLRSEYLAEANNQIAGEYAYEAGFYPGWYWDPYMWDYTYLGWDPFFSPFGWGFYPWGGVYGGWGFYGRGYAGGMHYHGRVSNGGARGVVGSRGFVGRPHPEMSSGFRGSGGFRGGFAGGGFHSSAGFSGGGFHGGGGFGGGGGRR